MGSFSGEAQSLFAFLQAGSRLLPAGDVPRGDGDAVAHAHHLLAQPLCIGLRCINLILFLQRRPCGHYLRVFIEEGLAIDRKQAPKLLADDLFSGDSEHCQSSAVDVDALEINELSRFVAHTLRDE